VRNALVPVAQIDAAASLNDIGRPRASFLAQLIATTARVPQTRARRRADPAQAVAAYAACHRSPVSGRAGFSRSL
jgi:hypothetical protein